MFDIGVLEIGLILVVALLVIGPERLPAVARTVGFWFGKTRKFVTSVQEDFNRELNKSEELQRLLDEQSKIKDVHEIIEQTVDETKKTVSVSANLTPPLDVLPEDKEKQKKEDVDNANESPVEQEQIQDEKKPADSKTKSPARENSSD